MKIDVAACGAFDPFHVGHLQHLEKARKLGDYLTVIINPDEDVIRKRGFVFIPMGQRIKMLEALRCVDEVIVAIDGDGTVAQTLRMIRPDILAKGGDRTPQNMPKNEIETCKEIGCQIVYSVGSALASSTNLIKRIREFEGELKHSPSGDFEVK